MKIKLILTFLLLLLIIPACVNVQVEEPAIEEEEPEAIVEEEEEEPEAVIIIPEVVQAEIGTLPENQYSLIYGDIIIAHGMNLGIVDMTSNSKLTLSIDGVEEKIQDTKVEEIFNNYYFSILDYNYKGESSQSNVTLKVAPVILGDNEYILIKDETLTTLGKEITLVESREDNYIKVTVCDEGTVFCDSYVNIAKSEEEIIREITVGNVKPFYHISEYAIVSIY